MSEQPKAPGPLASLLATAGVLLALGVIGDGPDGPPSADGVALAEPTPATLEERPGWGTAADAKQAGLEPRVLHQAERAVDAQVRGGAFPGAALAIGRGDQLVVKQGIGQVSWDEGAVDPDQTVYDIASLTKVVATTAAAMVLTEDGRVELDAPVSTYLPGFMGGGKDRLTMRHLLTHTSGLPAGIEVGADDPAAALAEVLATPLEAAPGTRVEYSDVGFVALGAALERAAGEPLEGLLQRRVYGPLGMRATTYGPISPCERCAPTWARGDGAPVRGVVHDPIARKLGGTAGNAGLFSTGNDLARFAAMLANGGELDGVRVFRPETIRQFTERQPGAETRALGWDTPDPTGRGAAGQQMSAQAFGHTGYTGTSLWVDPERKTWVVLLANRTFQPRAPNRIMAVRRSVHNSVAEAANLGAEALGDSAGE